MLCDLIIEEGKCAIYYNHEKLTNIDAIIPRIGSAATSFGSTVIRQFENLGVFTTLHAEALLKARNKLTCMQMLTAAGIKVPKTGIGKNLLTIRSIIDEIGQPPYIVKLATGTQGLGVILSETKNNAESIIEAFHKTDEKVMVQEFIKEVKGSDVRVFVIDNEIVGVMKRQARPGEFRSNIHRGAQSFIIELTEEEKRVALLATRVMGLKIAGVDMLQTNQGPMVLEVNASPGLEGIEATTQVDIAKKMIEFIERSVNI
jgi:ribosomal protein S6--L-glutamate ligase